MTEHHYDLVIIGAGLSGVGVACHFTTTFPGKKYLVLESRKNLGGTWDLFKYPGIRSDSDMYTLGYSFRPWKERKAIADGTDIWNYIDSTAEEYGVKQNIRFESSVLEVKWDSALQTWEIIFIDPVGTKKVVNSQFLYSCSGYYSYHEAYLPDFKNLDRYKGVFVHPQFWPDSLEYENRKIIVIGSGATAVTLVPKLAEKAKHVTMLQRSPTYIVSRPSTDKNAKFLEKYFSEKLAYRLARWKNILASLIFYSVSRRWPGFVKRKLLELTQRFVGSAIDVDKHLTPVYKPWDQRVCLVPNGDLFKCLKAGRATIVTEHINEFTSKGILLQSGEELEADVVISATGLKMIPFGGIKMFIDEEQINFAQTTQYKGVMLSGIPNFFVASGYTNASWTLKCDLTSQYFCRLVNYCLKKGHKVCVPKDIKNSEKKVMQVGLESGYILRSIEEFPREGLNSPWKLRQNYFLDLFELKLSRLRNKNISFS